MPSISSAGCFFKVFGYYYDFKKFVHLFVYPLHIDYIYVNLNIWDSLHITHIYIYIIKLYIHKMYFCSLVHQSPIHHLKRLNFIWYDIKNNTERDSAAVKLSGTDPVGLIMALNSLILSLLLVPSSSQWSPGKTYGKWWKENMVVWRFGAGVDWNLGGINPGLTINLKKREAHITSNTNPNWK